MRTNSAASAPADIASRKEVLEKTRTQLKKEFVGIDPVIDRLLNTISCWYIFPEIQERPVIVNLWGMTGTGKTSLVKRLAALLDYQQRFYHFDLGANSDSAPSLKMQLKSLFSYSSGVPAIIALDEFQHARTLDEDGDEIEKSYSRIIWELLDSGKFQGNRENSDLDELHDFLEETRFFVSRGVKVRAGIVVENEDLFREMKTMSPHVPFDPEEFTGEREKKKRKHLRFLPSDIPALLHSLAEGRFKSIYDLKLHLLSLDERGILRFLEEMLLLGNSRKEIDCSKSLIVIMGNLDEAYTMSGNFNPDISADEFHELSLAITLPDIKRALRFRFRNEQIARLGNNHIIYPAFSSASFRGLIELELECISRKMEEKFGWKLLFDESIRRLLYREGVFPAQGTRPLYSTIQQLVHSRIMRIVYEAKCRNLQPDHIFFSFENGSISVQYLKDMETVYTFRETPELTLEKLRSPKQDEMQAITAVHESGHAILSALLLRIIPESIFSASLDTGASGYVLLRNPKGYLSRKDLINQAAVFLGGLVAEQLIFGREHSTTGSEDDLCKATTLAAEAIRDYGLGDLMAAIQVKDYRRNTYIHDTGERTNRQVVQLITEARHMAERTLKEHENVLLRMADYLSDHRVMHKEAILHCLLQFTSFPPDYFTGGEHAGFYRRQLKDKVARLDGKKELAGVNLLLSLNKKGRRVDDAKKNETQRE